MASNLVPCTEWAVVRDELIEELEAIGCLGRIHNRLRFDDKGNNERFKKLMQPQGSSKIRAATIMRVSQTRAFHTNHELIVRTSIEIDFWYEMSDRDDSQAVFDQCIDDVLCHFQEPLRLDGCLIEILEPIQLSVEEHVQIAGELAHHATFTLIAQERVHQPTFR